MTREKTKLFGEDLHGAERRREIRHAIQLNVNYSHDDTYLFSHSSNLSEMGIFLVTANPLSAGTVIDLRFDSPGGVPVCVAAEVIWIDPGSATSESGMGLRFIDPDTETRNRIRAIIRTMAYLD
ncbi:MAG: PilZ domain-containing protein [Proteobacteria bacterium]|nr:PilZ domain-containing protein [Pseudomonadota bacterium]